MPLVVKKHKRISAFSISRLFGMETVKESRKLTVGIALSSGGARGLAHIGVLEVLKEHGIHVDVISGSSMGAFIGALHAKGVSTPQMRTLAESFNSKFELWKLADPVIPPVACFFKGEKVKEMLRDQIDDAAFRDLEIPLSIIALNLETHEKLVISHGNVADAVHASCAIPGVVCPVEWEGHRCLDGGIVDPVPVQPIRDQVDVVIAVTLSPSEEELAAGMMKREKDAPKDFSKRIFKSVQRNTSVYAEGNVVDTLRRSLKSAQTQIANASCELADIIISPKIFDLSWHSFESMERIIDAGRQAALNQMPIIQQKIAEISKIKGVKDPSKVKTIT